MDDISVSYRRRSRGNVFCAEVRKECWMIGDCVTTALYQLPYSHDEMHVKCTVTLINHTACIVLCAGNPLSQMEAVVW